MVRFDICISFDAMMRLSSSSPFSQYTPIHTQPQAVRIMAMPLALTTLREAGGAVAAAYVRRRPLHNILQQHFHHQVRPSSSSTASSSHSISTTSSSSSKSPALFALLAATAAAAMAVTSLSSSSQCETAHARTEEGEGEGEAMKEVTATASATSAPSFSEHHDRVDTKLHRAYPEFLKVSD